MQLDTQTADVTHELQHLRTRWLWLLLLGILLVVAGAAAIIVPPATVGTTLAVTIVLGVLLMIGGVAMIVTSFWVGKWSGFLIQMLVGLLYVACGFVMTEKPVVSAVAMTVFIAVSFIVLGIFRSIGALMLRFPEWGWALLNGVITFLAGIVIYRQLPFDALWVIGLLVGLEMIFNGWTWIMLAVKLRQLSRQAVE
ncbi:MAG TPA: HdeD family acid-resistance protein [Planctomycetaceae bacterium]|nr:HdeD family acid-resistance protein [Planctomycetaceae bacterium]